MAANRARGTESEEGGGPPSVASESKQQEGQVEGEDVEGAKAVKKKAAAGRRKGSSNKKRGDAAEEKGADSDGGNDEKKPPAKKKAKKEVKTVTTRTATPIAPLPAGPSFKVISWNVNGFAAVVKNSLAILQALVDKEKPDLLCLQETKLQPGFELQHKGILKGYKSFWNCCTAKKGYSGTVVFVKESIAGSVGEADGKSGQQKLSAFLKKSDDAGKGGKGGDTPLVKLQDVQLGFKEHDSNAEGRVICCEFDKCFVVGVYVPNSGMKLERLEYRLKDFNPSFTAFLNELAKKKPVVCTGDLNVATFDEDIYNVDAPHVMKVPGCTPQERQAQQEFLASGWSDVHRDMYPDATGQYTYWSVRTAARPDNKGLRLDYFLVDKETAEGRRGLKLLQSYIIHQGTEGVSDHCPVALVLGPAA